MKSFCRWSGYAAPVAVVLSAAQALVNDAIRSIQAEMPVLDTGNIRNDLIAMYRTALSSLIERPLIRPLYLKLFGELHSNPAVFQVFCVN